MERILNNVHEAGAGVKARSVATLDKHFPPQRRTELYDSVRTWASQNPKLAVRLCNTPLFCYIQLTSQSGSHIHPRRPHFTSDSHLHGLLARRPHRLPDNLCPGRRLGRTSLHWILRWCRVGVPRADRVYRDHHGHFGVLLGIDRLLHLKAIQRERDPYSVR